MISRKGASRQAAVRKCVRVFEQLARAVARAARSKMLSRQCWGDDMKGGSVRVQLYGAQTSSTKLFVRMDVTLR